MAKHNVSMGLLLALLGSLIAGAQASSPPKKSMIPDNAAYLGQKLPGDAAQVFAPDVISTATCFAQNVVFTPDGRELYFTVTNGQWDAFAIWQMAFKEDRWTTPVKADFLGKTMTLEPFITPDGKRIYFNAGDIRNTDLWYCERNTETWSTPTQLPASINTPIYEWYPSVSQENTIFFARSGDLYYSPFQNGQYSQAEKLGIPVNTSEYREADPYVAPQEEYLIFQSIDRPGGFGQADLYISYKKANGQWTHPKNMGPAINTAEFECGPAVTHDGKYLFFTRREQWLTDKPSKVYWISADIIERLKHTNFTPYVSQPLEPQTRAENQQFTFTVPDTTFVDDDGNHTLTYAAVLGTGAAWPAWLHFDPATRTLSGTPTEKGTASIKISATDTAGATTSTPFTILITNPSQP